MGHEPSLYHLFRRSKYCGDDEVGHRSGNNAREVFAVAALGFVLQHDAEFRKFFLHTFLDAPKVNPDDIKIRCQDRRCSDLLLYGAGFSWVIEAKITAGLEDHQNPNKKLEFERGYGKEITEQANEIGSTDPHYVVLQVESSNESGEALIDGKRLPWKFKSWQELIAQKESPLVKDFLDSMAQLNIPQFTSRLLIGMKNAPHTNAAANVFKTLEAVCSKRKLRVGTAGLEWDVEIGGPIPFFGIKIKRDAKGFRALSAISKNKTDAAWFGYEQSEQPRRSVWIYSSGKEAERFLKARDIDAQPTPDNNYLVIKDDSQKDDLEWFSGILQQIGDNEGQ